MLKSKRTFQKFCKRFGIAQIISEDNNLDLDGYDPSVDTGEGAAAAAEDNVESDNEEGDVEDELPQNEETPERQAITAEGRKFLATLSLKALLHNLSDEDRLFYTTYLSNLENNPNVLDNPNELQKLEQLVNTVVNV